MIAPIAIPPVFATWPRDKESDRQLGVIHSQGGILDILAETNDGIISIVNGLIYGEPRIFLLCRLIEDIHIVIVFAEITALHDVNAHYIEEAPIHEDAGKVRVFLAFTSAPRHITVFTA